MLSTRITAAHFRSDRQHPLSPRHMAVNTELKTESRFWEEGVAKIEGVFLTKHVMSSFS